MPDGSQVGKIGWIDITVEDATGLRDFYKKVAGWKSEDVSMGEYPDFSMAMPSTDEVVTGICHARGSNADLNIGWLVCITVEDVEASATACDAQGGKVIVRPRGLAAGKFCVIEDPSVATAALNQL